MLFTDGIVEAERADREEFGERRLAEVAIARRGAPPAALVDAIFEQVTRFGVGSLQDDATLVVLAVE